ncbi:hypothetical protein [Candidatus Chloroploca sp. Khr17]|uniref:hypothetical protein n=1 Tax=Candidatus Chloroploca sp. Khr17 TaxID=2496869 RepID=UPI00101CAC08|nr:hypothetical protein [Candidatus Chloroploca sp. Khr17]
MQRQLSGVTVAVNGSALACQAHLRGLDEAAQAGFATRSRGLQPDGALVRMTKLHTTTRPTG